MVDWDLVGQTGPYDEYSEDRLFKTGEHTLLDCSNKGGLKLPVVKKQDRDLNTSSSLTPATRDRVEVALPEELSVPCESLLDYVTLIYGEKKIGKTTLAAQFPDAIFLMFEPGGKALRIYQAPIKCWAEFVAYIDLLEQDDRFKTVVIDTVDIAYDQCFNHMCKKLRIEHPTDENDFGKSWGQIENEFISQMTRLLNMKKGVIFISHSVDREGKTRYGQKFVRTQPTMPTQAHRYLTGVADIWAYYGYEKGERYLTIDGDDYIGAGCRLEDHFRTPNGERVKRIPMGSSASEAYFNLTSAFDNLQETPDGLPGDEDEIEVQTVTEGD